MLDPSRTWHAFVQDDFGENPHLIESITNLKKIFVYDKHTYRVTFSDLGGYVSSGGHVTGQLMRDSAWLPFAKKWMPEMYDRVQISFRKQRRKQWMTSFRGLYGVSTDVLLARSLQAYMMWIELLEDEKCLASDCCMEAQISVFFRCDQEILLTDATNSCLLLRGSVQDEDKRKRGDRIRKRVRQGSKTFAHPVNGSHDLKTRTFWTSMDFGISYNTHILEAPRRCSRNLAHDRLEIEAGQPNAGGKLPDGIYRCLKKID